jgi:hypothetical protein
MDANQDVTIAGCGYFGRESLIQGAVFTVKDIGKGRYHLSMVAGPVAAKAVEAGRLGTRSRRNRPGKPPIRSD